MSDGRPRPRRRSSSRVATVKTTVAALAAAGVITAGLAAQMAVGRDPALGAGGGAAHKQPAQPAKDTGQTAPPAPAPVVTATS